jgi:tetratricopeptide (TPR) repeat protein
MLLTRSEFEAKRKDPVLSLKYAQEALELAQKGKLAPTRLSALTLSQAADALEKIGSRPHRAMATNLHQLTYPCIQAVFGAQSEEMVNVIRNDGVNEFLAGNRATGAEKLRRAEALSRTLTKPISPNDNCWLQSDLGWMESSQGHWKQAEEFNRLAHALGKKLSLTLNDRLYLSGNLAGVLADQARFSEAIPFQSEARDVAVSQSTVELVKVQAMSRLATLRWATNDHAGYSRDVAAIYQRVEKRGASATVDEWALAARAAGLAPSSEGVNHEARAIQLEAAMKNFPQYRLGFRALALLYLRAGMPEKTIATLGTTTSVFDDILMALAFRQKGKKIEAEAAYRSALARQKSIAERAEETYAYNDSDWQDRLEERILIAEWDKPAPESAPPPRRGK